ncbi:hypothetical protein OROMI_019597 [Orobanche minor]
MRYFFTDFDVSESECGGLISGSSSGKHGSKCCVFFIDRGSGCSESENGGFTSGSSVSGEDEDGKKFKKSAEPASPSCQRVPLENLMIRTPSAPKNLMIRTPGKSNNHDESDVKGYLVKQGRKLWEQLEGEAM